MSDQKSKKDTYFNDDMKRRLVENFVVSYYNKLISPDLAIKTIDNKNVVMMVGPANIGKYDPNDIWSYDNSSWNLVLKDNRFNQLNELVDKYSDRIETPELEKPAIEKKLYSLILLLMREGRIQEDFELEPQRDAELDNLASKIDRISKLIDNVEKRVRSLENLAERIPR